ncbi:MAG: hypothetical protein J6T57_00255 [Alphaproteobacteria bacterium]|nr:hypothetical protein [Alphaproteobacteria bacterium]
MKHLRQVIATIISMAFFYNKDKKQRIYDLLKEYSVFDIFNVKQFEKTPVRKNSVLLVETNRCHGEVISAYFKYFQDLGYNVDIIMHNVIYNEKHFTRHDISKVNIFHCLSTAMHKMLKSTKMEKYKAIFIMTPMNYTFAFQSVFDIFPELTRFNNLYIVAHNTPNIESYYQDFNQTHIFGLGRRLNDYPSTNPHLFGKVQKNSTKHNQTTFITVGGISPKRKNHNILISAIKQLVNAGYDFRVIVVGGGGKIPGITNEIKKYIITPGRQVGEKMFQFMEQSDFFLPLWDKNNPEHDKYKTNQVSGSPQLIYGFNKIPIVQQEFAEFYDFDNTNAIIYTGDNLAAAMESAIVMTDQEYKKIYNGLDKLSREVYNESKENIRAKIK